jgi:hypothetical protein
MKMEKFTFAQYNGNNIVLLICQCEGAWIAHKITKTGEVIPIDHLVLEKNIDVIEPVKIKNSELDRLNTYHNNFVKYYKSLNL